MTRKAVSSIGVAAGALLLTPLAHAHSFVCEKTVNDMSVVEVDAYPTTLSYEFTVINDHDQHASTAQSVSDPAMSSLGFSFEPATPFTLPFGGSVSDTFDVVVESFEDCMDLAAADGVADDRFVNVFEVTWDRGAAQCSATVVCVAPPPPPPPPQGLATRTPGFFKTHPEAVEACLAESSFGIDLEAALGLLWGTPARFDTGEKRSKLDKSRFLLARHLLVASCNVELFDSQPEDADLIADAFAALFGTDCELMRELAEALDEFNNSGTDEDLPEGFEAGPASPRDAAAIADDPTTPSGETCNG